MSEVHLFGSALREPDPVDLDLIVVYDKAAIAPRDAPRLRARLKAAVSEVSVLPCDVTLFTREEQEQTRFSSAVAALCLWSAGQE